MFKLYKRVKALELEQAKLRAVTQALEEGFTLYDKKRPRLSTQFIHRKLYKRNLRVMDELDKAPDILSSFWFSYLPEPDFVSIGWKPICTKKHKGAI